MMPAPAALGEVATVARNHDVQYCKPSHSLRMVCGKREGDWATPIVADQEETVNPEMIPQKPPYIICDSFLVVSGDGT
jgi:hypothetical protein